VRGAAANYQRPHDGEQLASIAHYEVRFMVRYGEGGGRNSSSRLGGSPVPLEAGYYTTVEHSLPATASWGGPPAGLLERRKSRTRGSGADAGVRPTFGICRLVCLGDCAQGAEAAPWVTAGGGG
jgi:hypothetical protein